MTDYIVPLSDGRKVKIKDVNSLEEAQAAAKNIEMREPGVRAARATDIGGQVDNFVRSMAKLPSLGFGDEIAARADAFISPYVDWALKQGNLGTTGTSTAPTYGERYDENLVRERAQNQTYQQENPGLDATATVTGGVLGAYGMLPKALLRGGFGTAGLTNMGVGAVEGFGSGEGGFGERAYNALKGSVMGGAAGAVLHPIVAGLGAGAGYLGETGPGRWIGENVTAPLAKLGPRLMKGVADAFVPSAGSTAAPFKPTGMPGGPFPGMSMPGSASAMATPGGLGALQASDPLTQAAVRRISDALERGGSGQNTIADARRILEELGPDATMADVNAMLTSLGTTAFIKGGPSRDIFLKALRDRAAATPERVTGDIRNVFGDPERSVIAKQQLQGERLGQADPLYQEAFAVDPKVPFNVSPEMQDLLEKTPSIRKAMADIVENFAQEGVTLTPAQVGHMVKRQLANSADVVSRTKAIDRNAIEATAEKWRTALHEANPDIAAADAIWQAKSKSLEALELGRTFMRQTTRAGGSEAGDAVSAPILEQRIPNMSGEEARAFLTGAADTMIEVANTGPNQARALARSAFDENRNIREKLQAMGLSDDAIRTLYQRAQSEKTFSGTLQAIAGGSDTAKKVIGAVDDSLMGGDIPTTFAGWLAKGGKEIKRLYTEGRSGNEAVRARTAQLLMEQNPYVQEDILKMAARQLAESQRRTRGVQRGLVIGGTQVNP